MISIITGLPGAGKTSWLVEQILMPMAAKNWEEQAIDSDGNKVTVKRRLFTNVKGLLLDHEMIGDDEMNSWPDWVKPGDIIVFDELQKVWPKVPPGSKKPKCISELETHRHYGIDIYALTQHPNLINDALVTLAGQHKHVRKVGNSRYATVYEWDGVSRSLLYKNSVSKAPWRRGKQVEKMYRSSSLHTKQKRAIPTVLFVLIFCFVALPIGFYAYSGKFKDRFFGGEKQPGTTAKPATSPSQTVQVPTLPPSDPPAGPPPPPANAMPAAATAAAPVFSGCARLRERCQCFDTSGRPVQQEPQVCEDVTRVAAGLGNAIKHLPDYDENAAFARISWARNDAEVLSYMADRQQQKVLAQKTAVK